MNIHNSNRRGRSTSSSARTRPVRAFAGSSRFTGKPKRPSMPTASGAQTRRSSSMSGARYARPIRPIRPLRPQRGGGRKMSTFNPSQFINANPVSAVQEAYAPQHTFGSMGLDTRLSRTIASLGMKTPTPIQDRIIPEILAGHDVIGLAETGTGKTAAFLIPLIERTLKNNGSRTLVLAPTRELAVQIEAELRTLSRGLRMFSVTCVGGMNIRPQLNALKRPNHFIIGTPGRVLDLINRKAFTPSSITTVVLDEADRMLDMGFIGDITKILNATPQERSTLLFSATMSPATDKLVHQFLRTPVRVSVKKKDVTDSIAQDVVHYNTANKFEVLTKLLREPEFSRVLVFGAMKHSVEKLAKQLSVNNIIAESIHGNKNHGQRQRALQKFKNGGARVLVATDVAARGIHVDNVTHVINYDLPATREDYVHRIGRTGRAEQSGKALTFVPGGHR